MLRTSAIGPVQAIKAIRVPNWERTQHVGVKDREDGGVQAESDSNDRDDTRSKHWAAPHSAKSITNVGPERLNEIYSTRLATLFCSTLTAAEV